MTIFFTADTHFNHANVIDYCKRPFTNISEMNEAIIANWNSVVAESDTVYHLGDIGLGRKDALGALVKRLNGTIYLIPGNHDYDFRLNHFIEMGIAGIALGNQRYGGYQLAHFPYEGDHTEEDRYAHSRPQRVAFCSWLLHGHVHDKWHVRDDMINVGVDVNNYAPISLEQVTKLTIRPQIRPICNNTAIGLAINEDGLDDARELKDD